MLNVEGTIPVPLTVFGGAVTEMAPEDLPEGASPFNQDVDFVPGSVFTRAGRRNQYVFDGLFLEQLAGFAASIPGTFDPSEAPWANPTRVTLGVPGSYAATTLNGVVLPSGGQVINFNDPNAGDSSGTLGTLTPSGANQVVLGNIIALTSTVISPGAQFGGSGPRVWLASLPSPTTFTATWFAGLGASATLAVFGTNGGTLTDVQDQHGSTTVFTTTLATAALTNPASSANAIIVCFEGITNIASPTPVLTITDDAGTGNVYQQIGQAFNGSGRTVTAMWICLNPTGGPKVFTITRGAGSFNGNTVTLDAIEVSGLAATGAKVSQILETLNFPISIPTTAAIAGLQLELSGNQTSLAEDAILTVTPAINGVPIPGASSITAQLPTVDGTIAVGNVTQNWNLTLTPALLNDSSFGFNVVASAFGGTPVGFSIYAAKMKVWFSPQPPQNFNWVKTYEQTDGAIDTLALDAGGILWDEDVINDPGVLKGIFTAIEPGTFAKSVTFDDVEYIALSDLIQGTDMPRQWNESWLDRVSQVGPGAPPSVAITASGSSIVSITQNPQIVLPTGNHDWTLISAAPSDIGDFGAPATPGNVMTLITNSGFVGPSYLKAGSNIQISGFPTINGFVVNNDPTGVTNPAFYTVTSVGTAANFPGGASYDWITFQVPFTTFYNQKTTAGSKVQATIATLTTAQQVPYLEVGNQFTIAGASPAGWNNTFTVLATPNASVLQISQTSLSGNVATYVYTLSSGSAPTVGEFVTVNGTLNGNGIFNVTNAVITAASPTSFSISLVGADITATAETGNGVISGTIFQFDPATTVTNPIIGNAGAGGTISTSGVMGIGTRKCVCIFVTRNQFITAPSPFVQFNITANATAIVASSIPIGPPNVIARILAFTPANLDNYFWIEQPVVVTVNGQSVTYSATIINDNTTTQATFSFPDTVLVSGQPIDVEGNNLFAQIELGSCRGFLAYSDRLIAWGEQNKIQNLLNLSFDGGIGVQSTQQQQTQPNVPTYPLGWTVDAAFGAGGQLNVSPLFGNSYYVKNATGVLQAQYGMIEQSAYQNQLGTPIVMASTKYSVRVTARCPGGAVTGSLVVDLFSPQLNQQFGAFTIPLASMSSTMQILTGTLLTTAFAKVPKDLLLRVYGLNLPNNADFEVDRLEPFPTSQPVFSTQFRASYANNQEAFDLVTGGFGPSQNQQPINGGLLLFDTLYALKESSWYSTSDNGVTEPNKWSWREVSNKVGTVGIHSYDFGEGWAVTACRAGVFFFNGGEPIKISQENDPVWNLINWKYGHTIWLRNDTEKKRITIGVPIATPNKYMPEMPANANPTSPNVVLMMSYRELATGWQMAETPPIRSSFSGRLLSPEPARKWSFWNIKAPYADFIDRGNNEVPEFFCSGYSDSKIFALDDTALDDDGQAINAFTITYGFTKPDTAVQIGLGGYRMSLQYLTATAFGSGTLKTKVYQNSVQNSLPKSLGDRTLSDPALNDLEIGANISATRFFIRMGTNAVGSSFRLSKLVPALQKEAWTAIRGRGS